MELTHHTDSGHGWLFVSHAQLATLGLSTNSFSHYSYYDDTGVYAEEDCDAGVVVEAHLKQVSCMPTFKNVHVDGEHWIRHARRCGA
jgi:hypothetical protein